MDTIGGYGIEVHAPLQTVIFWRYVFAGRETAFDEMREQAIEQVNKYNKYNSTY
ncbi:hypothetical protein QL185_00980 [Cronobacter malonaticus]|uniref:hypothetical protein n=1 Tax=Cronobacter malonaticus TaxID=413503 RepID=UPI0013758A80|nr:hypothetical protein [Cronobacter malonaticus]MDI6458131.1 hypothetical protein [Cronobacter malonaticus]